MPQLVQSIKITLDDEISRAIKRAADHVKSFQGRLDGVSASLKNMGKAAYNAGRSMSVGLTAPITAAGFFMVKAASDAEETANKFNVVFRDVSDQAKMVAESLAENYGMSREESQKLLSNTADLMTGFGMSGAAALSMSEEVQKLAADLGSFNNLSTADASRALTSGLLGNHAAVESLGIIIKQELVDKMVEAMEIAGKFTDETELQKLALARFKIATMQSGNAIGDFARSQESLANQIKILKADSHDMSVEFGKILIPVVLDVINAMKPYLQMFKELSPEIKKTIVIVAGLVAGLGPLLFIFGQMATAIGALLPIIGSMGSVFSVVGSILAGVAGVISGPVLIAIAAIAAGAAIIIQNWEQVKSFFISLGEFFKATFLYIDGFMQGFLGFSPLEKMKEKWEPIKTFFKELWSSIVEEFKQEMELIGKIIDKATAGIRMITDKISSAAGGARELGEKVRGSIGGFFDKINPFSGDEEPSVNESNRVNSIASQSSINNNNNNVVVNLRVDKNQNPVVESASSDNGLRNLDVNMGVMIP